MAGENPNPTPVETGGSNGENGSTPEERGAKEQKFAGEVINVINETEGDNQSGGETPQDVVEPQPAGEETSQGEEETQQQAESEQRAGDKVEWDLDKLKQLLRMYKDKDGNPYLSESTVERLANMGRNVDPAQEERDLAIKKAQDAAYKAAQMEIARTLNGRGINKYLLDARRDMKKLQAEIESLRATVYLDPSLKKMRERHLAEAEAELLAMDRRRKMIENLKKGDDAKPVGSEEYGDFSAVSAELDANQPESMTATKMDLAAFDRLLPMFKNDPETAAKLLLARQKCVEKAEQEEDEADFASGQSGEATAEEVAEAAEAAGEGTGDANKNKKGKNKEKKGDKGTGSGDSKKKGKGSGEAKGKSHADKLEKIANETRPGSWMSDDEKREAKEWAEREKRVKRVVDKVHNRKGFNNRKKGAVAKVLAWLGISLAAVTAAGQEAQAAEAVVSTEDKQDNVGDTGRQVYGSEEQNSNKTDEEFLNFANGVLESIGDDGISKEQA